MFRNKDLGKGIAPNLRLAAGFTIGADEADAQMHIDQQLGAAKRAPVQAERSAAAFDPQIVNDFIIHRQHDQFRLVRR